MLAGLTVRIPVLVLNRGVSFPLDRWNRLGYTTKRVTAIVAVCESIKRGLVGGRRARGEDRGHLLGDGPRPLPSRRGRPAHPRGARPGAGAHARDPGRHPLLARQRRRARVDGARLPRPAARAAALRGRSARPRGLHARPGLPARHRRVRARPRASRGHPRDPGRERPRGGRLLRRARPHRLAARGPRGGDAGDRHRPRGTPRAHPRGRDGAAGPAAQSGRARPGHPAHAGESDAGEDHGPGGPQAGRGPFLHDQKIQRTEALYERLVGRERAP